MVMMIFFTAVSYSQHIELKYEFPPGVNDAIMRGLEKMGADSAYIQFCSREGNLNIISVRKYKVFKGELFKAISSSSRSVDLADKKMPIMFYEDVRYLKCFRNYSKDRNGYVIVFTDDGKIKEEHEVQ